MFEILEHPADIGFRARGRTQAELFASAAEALVSIAWELEDIAPRECYEVSAAGDDIEALLVNWLSEVLYWIDGKRVLPRRFVMKEPGAGEAWGEPYDPARHHAKLVVKGVTYHQLKIGQDEGGWWAEVYLDI